MSHDRIPLCVEDLRRFGIWPRKLRQRSNVDYLGRTSSSPCSRVVWIRCVTKRRSVFLKDEGNSTQVNDSTCRENTGRPWFFFCLSLNLEVQSAQVTSRDGYPSMCPHRLPVLLKRHPDFAFLFGFWTRTVSWICCWTWWVLKGRQDGVRLREEVGTSKSCNRNKQGGIFQVDGISDLSPS